MTNGAIKKGTVLVDGGKIVGIGPEQSIPKDAEILDAKGKIVMPGLIDAH